MLFNHEMSIPHKARYQYIKLLELAFGIGICAWIFYHGWILSGLFQFSVRSGKKLSQTIPHMQISDAVIYYLQQKPG